MVGVAEVVQQVLVHGELELGHPVVDQAHAVVRGLQRVTLQHYTIYLTPTPFPSLMVKMLPLVSSSSLLMLQLQQTSL